jgi:protease-4
VGIGCLIVVLLAIVAVVVFPLLALSGVGQGLETGKGNVGVIDVSGEIHSGGGGLFAEAGADGPIMEMLRKAGDDNSIKAVVLNINSPGGGPAASQSIAEEVRRLDKRKPVIAAMGDEAASGAYYIASACREIVANPATLTGSIGVIMESMTFYKLLQKYGIDAQSITTGKYKDMGSPFREMRPDERALIQAMLQDTYSQFVSDVAKGRKMDVAKVRALADGRVWTGAQAKEIGLVDQVGNLYDAIELAGQEAGVKGKAEPRYLGEPRGLADLLRSSSRLRLPADAPEPLPAAAAHPLWMYEGPGAPPVVGGP